jgi:molybdopterin-guanine dinucleotide biosynthesis protein A
MIEGVALLAAFILAGGNSTRMGRDKGFLELAGKSLIIRALELGLGTSDQVIIVGDPGKFARFGAVVSDCYPGRGPLGGIHAALRSSSRDLNLILAVDLPFLKPGFLEYLVGQSESCPALVTVPMSGGRFQPLCAVYRKGFEPLARRALEENRNKVEALFSRAPVRVISEEEMSEQGFSPAMFRNLNAPEDWEWAKQAFASAR